MLGAVSRKPGIIVTVFAVIVAASVEAVLIWLVDRLPIWAQVLIYSVPFVMVIAGYLLLWRDKRKSRRWRQRMAEAKVARATVTQATVTQDRPAGPGTE